MLSAISSYIWGAEVQAEEIPESQATQQTYTNDDEEILENDWIFIQQHDDLKSPSKRRRRAHFNDDAASTASESNDSVTQGLEDSWLVTPPQCFSGRRRRNKNVKMSAMENLLIEHPSMSIYHAGEQSAETDEGVPQGMENASEVVTVNRRNCDHKAMAGRLQLLECRKALRELNGKDKKRAIPKNTKQKNLVYVRSNGARKNKQYGRMAGKHTGMGGKRGN